MVKHGIAYVSKLTMVANYKTLKFKKTILLL